MELALEDHFGASRSLVELAGRVMVLVYAERRGASAARFWLILALSILAGIAVLLQADRQEALVLGPLAGADQAAAPRRSRPKGVLTRARWTPDTDHTLEWQCSTPRIRIRLLKG